MLKFSLTLFFFALSRILCAQTDSIPSWFWPHRSSMQFINQIKYCKKTDTDTLSAQLKKLNEKIIRLKPDDTIDTAAIYKGCYRVVISSSSTFHNEPKSEDYCFYTENGTMKGKEFGPVTKKQEKQGDPLFIECYSYGEKYIVLTTKVVQYGDYTNWSNETLIYYEKIE